jgi:hypothetical protein
MRSAFVFLALWIAACGARTPLDLGETSGDDDDDGDGGVHSGIDGSSLADARPPNKPTRIGYIAAIGAGDQGAFAVARFYPQTVDPACAYLGSVGTCTLVSCFTNTDAPPSRDAGLINVSVSSTSDGALLSYVGASPTGTYPTATFASPSAVRAGASIDFVGHGAVDVPAFDTRLTAPSFGMLTSPVLQVPTAVDSSQDLPLTWGPIATGDAVFSLSPPTSSDMTPTLVCIFDSSSGAGVVPHAQLEALKHLSPSGDVQASFLAMSRASTVAGDWTVSVISVTETGTSQQSGTITLE